MSQAVTANAQAQERTAPDPSRGKQDCVLSNTFLDFVLSPPPKKNFFPKFLTDSNLGDSRIINWDSCEFSGILNHWFSGLSLTLFTSFK